MRRVLLDGHRIGNHNWAHIREIMFQAIPKPEKVIQGYNTTEHWIKEALGAELWG